MGLHEDSIVVDLHADTVLTMRALGYGIGKRHNWRLLERVGFAQVDLPRLREGGITAQFFGVVTFPYPVRGCARACLRQLGRLRAAARTQGLIWAREAEDVRRAKREGRLAIFAGIEGGHNLEGRLEWVRRFHDEGVRYLGLAHLTANAIAPPSGGVGADREAPLSDLGREVVREMNRLGMIVDLAHVGRRASLDVCRVSVRPVIVSHAGIAGVHASWRNIDDDQVRAVAATDGVVGIMFARRHLGRRRGSVGMLAPHFEHVRRLVGARHLALGSDFDGAVGPPRGLENVSKLSAVTALLQERNWTEKEIQGVLGENVLRVLEAH